MRFEIVNKSEKEAEIFIDDIIGWDDDNSWIGIKKKLAALAESKTEKIIVNIASQIPYLTIRLVAFLLSATGLFVLTPLA